MNLAVFFQSVIANVESCITSRFNKVLKYFYAGWPN